MGMAVLWVVAVCVFAADRLSKRWVAAVSNDGACGADSPLQPTWNRQAWIGRPLSLAAGVALWAAAAVAAVVVVALDGLILAPTTPLALGAALGGAAGNLTDRVRHGAVFDFIDLRFGGRMPGGGISNLADFAIVGGLLAAVVGELMLRGLG